MPPDRDGGEQGQAAVELALVLPLVVLLLLAVVQVTLVARDQILLVHAARNAARAAAVGERHDANPGNVDEPLKSDRLLVDIQRMGGDRSAIVVAQLRYASPTDVPLVGPLLPDIPLRAKAAMPTETTHDRGLRVGSVRSEAGTSPLRIEHST
jgi:hypothetical protein